MGQNVKGLERCYPVLAGAPIDLNSPGMTGDYFNMSKYRRCLVIIAFGDGTATTGDIVATLSQSKTVANGDSSDKVLNALVTGRIYAQVAATYAAYAQLTGGWTEETQVVADEVWTDDDSGEQCGIICLEIRQEDLDVDSGFIYFKCSLTAAASAKVAAMIYLGLDPTNEAAPVNMANPLV